MGAIDLNADLGETVGGVPTADDEAMFAVISSPSIACGGHAGDASSMRDAASRAARFGVAVGAHPSYADAVNFGRVRHDPDPDPAELQAEITRQLDALVAAGADIRYVKPHGALYHAVRESREQADAVASAVAALAERLGRPLPVLGLDGEISRAAERVGLPFAVEAFLDRGYLPDGGLVPRSSEGAVLSDPAHVADRALRLATEGTVLAIDGSLVDARAVSLCLHGDSPAAVAMARAVRAALDSAHIDVRAPW